MKRFDHYPALYPAWFVFDERFILSLRPNFRRQHHAYST